MTDAATHAELIDVVLEWIADDPDPVTAAELSDLLAREEWDGLIDRFSGLLQFGTAGLRGELGAGPHRMNRAVVIRAAKGLVDYVSSVAVAGARPRMVIGYDARHNSEVFARDTAAVATAAGFEALLLPSALPTPVLAFAVRHLDADAGVMVTASHNPPRDNGYKVYLGGATVTGSGQGAQIVSPFDALIAQRIEAVASVASVPRAPDGWTVLGPEVLAAYRDAVGLLANEGPRDLRIVLTPMHGVGGEVATDVLHAAGFEHVLLVPEQALPDPDFPTVAFPNPEEPGAIDLALGLAQDTGADLVIANDPDADRCAIAVRDERFRTARGAGNAAAEGWRMLHGDEVGALLGQAVAERITARQIAEGIPPGADDAPVLACSIVSSRLLSRIAAAHGLRHTQTLTGFKWIARVDGLAYGYEEALGYCVAPDLVRDKDGVSAALLVAQLAARLKAAGRTLVDALDDLARAHGLHLSDQLAARFTDLSEIPATLQRVQDAPPTSLAGSPVVEIVDLLLGTEAQRGGLPPTAGLRLLAADGTRVIIRPSGTEPKIKCYLEVIVPVEEHASTGTVTQARVAARDRLETVKDELRVALGL